MSKFLINPTHIGALMMGFWAILGTATTAFDLRLVQVMERQVQTAFFEFRGQVSPPDNIVILAMDDESLAIADSYNPQNIPDYFKPIQSWPWQRRVYGEVIEKLMQAGALAVGLDVVLEGESAHGAQDDQILQQTLQKYPDRVAIASVYEDSVTPNGLVFRFVQPKPEFRQNSQLIGFINYLPEPNAKIHRLARSYQQQFSDLVGNPKLELSFAEATLNAAKLTYSKPRGSEIYFYGASRTFTTIPFFYVLEPKTWESYLKKGEIFKDKIVLIGPTADFFKDFQRTPFSQTWRYPAPMSGIEIHANSIGTLLQNRAITELFANSIFQSLLVFILISGASVFISLVPKQPSRQFSWGILLALIWLGSSYLIFTYGYFILPTFVPALAIALCGLSSFTTGAINDRLEKNKIRRALERYVAAPIASEILKQPGEYQALQKGKRIQAAVLFSDIRNFTTLSTQLEPEALVEQLNTYLDAMVEPILAVGGTVDKFIGDAIMAEFGSPISQGAKTDALNAIKAALGMRKNLNKLRGKWQQEGKKILFNGIGINYGELIAGDIGSVQRREYAAIGDTVNVASRVEGLTKNFGTDILITDSLYQLVNEFVEVIEIEPQRVKGRSEPVKVYSLIGLKGEDSSLYHQVREDFHEHLYQE